MLGTTRSGTRSRNPRSRACAYALTSAHPDGVAAEASDLLHDLAPPNDKRGATLAQRAVEVGERLEEEAQSIPRDEVAVEDGVVEDEQRDDPLGLTRRLRERRLIVDAQVTREEDDGRPHSDSLPARIEPVRQRS